MKARAVFIVDYDNLDGFKDAAEEQDKLEQAIQSVVDKNPKVVFFQLDMKERRGDKAPDIKNMKFRTS